MEGSKFNSLFNALEDQRINEHGFGELLASVHHPMPHSMDTLKAGQTWHLDKVKEKLAQKVVGGAGVIPQGQGLLRFRPAAGDSRRSQRLPADALDKAFGEELRGPGEKSWHCN